MRLSLTLKGLAAIALVFSVQLVLICLILNTLSDAEVEAAREARAKEIVGRTSQFIKRFYDAGSTVKNYFQSRNEASNRKYEAALNAVRSEVKWLKRAMRDNPESLAAIKRIDSRSSNMLDMLQEAKQAADSQSIVAVMPAIRKFREDLQPNFNGLIKDVNNLLASQKAIVNESPKLQAKSREQARNILYGGILANITLAIWLGWFFLGDIAKRVHIVIDNTNRLASGRELNSLLAGKDEVATLDAAFHNMSDRLKEARDRELSMIESMPVGLLLVDKEGGIDFVNSTGESIFRYDKDYLLSMGLAKLFSGVSADDSSFVEEICSYKDGRIGELFAKTSSGDLIPVEISSEPLSTVDGDRVLVVVLDVTERHELQELRRSFVSMVSHELRTPLGSVQNFLGLLNMGILGELPDKTSRLAKSAERSVDRLIGLINELLDLEKMEEGKLVLDIRETNLSEVLSIVKESVDGFGQKHDVELVYPGDSELLFSADENKIAQVLINLVSNAVKFSSGGQSVELMCEATESEVRFSVVDKGRGIPKGSIDLVFEKFQQVEKGDQVQKGGSGLGLAICKAIVESHNGTIGVESELGKGSTFWFLIPRNSA